jgi:predicted ATP-dependent endonuclease of OLD family
MKKSKKRKLPDLNLSIHNYKGFKNETNFNLKRINLFVGANSSGKSSLRNFISLLNDNRKADYDIMDFEKVKNNNNVDYKSILHRGGDSDEISFTCYGVKFTWCNREAKFHGGHKTTKGHLKSYKGLSGREILFDYYYDKKLQNNQIKINTKLLIDLLISQKDNLNYYTSPINYDVDFDLEIAKLRMLPIKFKAEKIHLSEKFVRSHYDSSYNKIGLVEYFRNNNIENTINDITEYLICRIFNEQISYLKEFIEEVHFISGDSSIVESGDEIVDDFPFPSIGYESKVVNENLGFETKIISVKDENAILYGRKQQVKINNDWYYLNELGSGLRKFINLITNFDYEYYGFTESNFSGLFFLEEPENKLHPDLEVKLIDYLLNKSNCRIVIETHSLNIVRALQLAVAEKRIDADEVGIFDFSMSENNGITINQIKINDQGVLESNFKSGFADLSRKIDNKLFDIYHKINSVN